MIRRSQTENLFVDADPQDARMIEADHYLDDGHDLDVEAGVQYSPTRHFDPETGRWLYEEAVGFADGANEYRYVGNAPSNVTDPTVE